MNPGGIRQPLTYAPGSAGEGAGEVTYGEAFAVQPFANALVTLTLTGAQLHTLLEQQFAGCRLGYPDGSEGQTSTRILQVSRGFGYAYSASAPPCRKVETGSLRLHGARIEPARTYRVTVNSFLAAGGDGFELLRAGTDAVTGVLDLDALEAHLAAGAPLPEAAPRVRALP
jgi:5'-nucleotidase